MRLNTLGTFVVLGAAAFLSGCEKKATVQGEPARKVETKTERKESMGGDSTKTEEKTTVKETELPRKLTLSQPSGCSLERGGTCKVDVKIDRTNLTGDVRIRFDKLPEGVEVIDQNQTLAGEAEKATFTLRANDNAVIVKDFNAQVTATGPDGLAVSQPFEVTIKDKK
jgi:hypothetical protein